MRAKKQFDQTKCSGNNLKTCSLDAFIEGAFRPGKFEEDNLY